MNTLVLFDLEQTLIDEWSNPVLWHDHNPSILRWLRTLGPFTSGLLSFAVWDDKDKHHFNANLRAPIEHAFGFAFSDEWMLTKNQLLDKARVWERKPFLDSSDFDDFFNKRKVVEDLWLNEFQTPNTRVILIDDTVPNFRVQALDVDNCVLELVNPLSAWFKSTF